MEKLIAILKVDKRTGEEVAKAASASLLEWYISDKIVAMSFDTRMARVLCFSRNLEKTSSG